MQIEIKVGSKSVYLRGSDKNYEICETRKELLEVYDLTVN